ncbi:MAG: hypothetical protein ABIK89_06815 [Planctomycetota bacterium]
MKREFSSLPAILSWAALVATFLGLAVPNAGLGGEASASPSVMRAVRRVQVHRVWSAAGMEADAETGISIYAHVEAVGLKYRSLLVEVRLRTPEGKSVPVAAEAPEGYADKDGQFYMSTRAPVFDDRFEWNELRASLPYEKVLDLPAGRPLRLIATVRVSAGGLSSRSEAEITIPPGPAPGVTRAVRLLALDLFSNSSSPEGTGDRAGKERGLAVEAYVEAVGLDRSKVLGRLSLRQEDGQALLSSDEETGIKKPFRSVVESDVVSDQALVLSHFIPYRAVGPEPGRRRLILTYSATCEGLTATTEEEHVLSVVAGQKDRPVKDEIQGAREAGE